MADVNWRDIRVTDCELSARTRYALSDDHGPAVTLGQIAAKTDAEMVRSPNVGRKTLREIREMIDIMQVTYPDPPPQRIFLPHATIDWALLARAIEFYKTKGYQYIEAPWAVSHESVAITCPNPQYAASVDGLGALVGSAEQSFLHLDLTGNLGQGKFMALTPCFRLGDDGDYLHHPYFMKLELYVNENPEISFVTMLSHVGLFNKEVLTETELDAIQGVSIGEGIDIELNGIEIGSYGVRAHGEHKWTFGTGLAEPRFSQARASLQN